MPAFSWSPANEGPTVSTGGSFSNAIGSAPNFRLVERLEAVASVKLPSIWASPLVIMPFMVGAESTWPSRTTANWSWVPKSACEILVNSLVPALLKASETTQLTCWPGTSSVRALQVGALDHRGAEEVLAPSSSQVTSGLSAIVIRPAGHCRPWGS